MLRWDRYLSRYPSSRDYFHKITGGWEKAWDADFRAQSTNDWRHQYFFAREVLRNRIPPRGWRTGDYVPTLNSEFIWG